MQDAVINASTELGREVPQEVIYKQCKPSLDEDTSMDDIMPCINHLFKVTVDLTKFTKSKGGIEASLLKCTDKHIRIILAKLKNKQTGKVIYNHAFVHRATRISRSKRKHIGALIDNRKGDPILLIEDTDMIDSEVARQVYVKFFGGDKDMEFRITSIFKIELL